MSWSSYREESIRGMFPKVKIRWWILYIICLVSPSSIYLSGLQGLELELITEDRIGLLSDITRIFRENGLCIRRAEISTKGGRAEDTFYVSEMSGSPVDAKTIDSIRRQIGQMILRVRQSPLPSKPSEETSTAGFLFGNFFKGRSFHSFRLIRSYSWTNLADKLWSILVNHWITYL